MCMHEQLCASTQVLLLLPEAQGLQRVFTRQLGQLQGGRGQPTVRQWTCFMLTLGALARSLEAERSAFLAKLAAARGSELSPERPDLATGARCASP